MNKETKATKQPKDMLERGKNKSASLFKQLFLLMRKDIEAGYYKPSEKLPTTDQLVEMYKVNRATVRRAISELKQEAYVYSIPAKGIFVSMPSVRTWTKKNVTISLVSPVMKPGQLGHYHMALLEAIRAELSTIQARLVLLPSSDYISNWTTIGANDNQEFLGMVQEAQPDANIYIGPIEKTLLQLLVEHGPKSVLIDAFLPEIKAVAISSDNQGGGFAGMKHLLDLGHRRIGIVTGKAKLPATIERLRGARIAMEECGVDYKQATVIHANHTKAGGSEATAKLLDQKNPPTAIFYFNDEMACAGMRVAQKDFKLRIPDDISMVGFDDVGLAGNLYPQLTSVKVSVGKIANLACKQLRSIIDGSDADPIQQTVPTKLMVRETTSPLK